VKGEDQHPLYKYLTEVKPETDVNGGVFEEKLKGFGHTRSTPNEILWNFEKFLIAKNGAVIARFAPDATAEDTQLIEKVEEALKK
jgi:glutathione peroxidase